MARRATDGAEGGSALCGGGTVLGALHTTQTTNARLGLGRCYSIPFPGSQQGKDLGAGVANVPVGTASYVRVYLRWSSNPSTAATFFLFFAGADNAFAKITPSGEVGIYDATSTQIGSLSSALTLNTWYRVEVGWTVGTTTSNGTIELRINGSTITSSTTANLGTASGRPIVGNPKAQTISGFTLLMDDICFNDGNGASQNSWPGEGKILAALPVSENSVSADWTKPGGSITNRETSIDNVPPIGVAYSTNPADAERQLENIVSSSTSDAAFNLQTYSNLGITSADTLTVVHPYVVVGSDSATDTAGALALISNPNQGAETAFTSFDNSIAGTFPSSWRCNVAAAQYSPVVTLESSPVLRAGKRTATTRAAMICQLGAMVEYLPFSGVVLPFGGSAANGNEVSSGAGLLSGSSSANSNLILALSALLRGKALAQARELTVKSEALPTVASVGSGYGLGAANALGAASATTGQYVPIAVSLMELGNAVAGGRAFIVRPNLEPTDVIFVDYATQAALFRNNTVVILESNSLDATIEDTKSFVTIHYA